MFTIFRTLLTARPGFSVFLVAVLIRFLAVLLFSLSIVQGGDFPVYWNPTQAFLGGWEYSLDDPFFAPGLSFFMLGSTLLFGNDTSSLLVGYSIVGALAAVGVYMLGNYLYGKRVAVAAGLLFAIWPLNVYQVFSLGQTALLASALLIWAVYFLLQGTMESRHRSLLIAGGLFGGFALTDVIGLYLPIVVVGWMLWVGRVRMPWRSIAISIFLFIGGFLMIVLPWTIRNIRVAGDFHSTPIISKSIEKDILQKKTIKRGTRFFRLHNAGRILEAAGNVVLTPYDLGMLSQFDVHQEIGHKHALTQIIRTGSWNVSTRQAAVLFGKVALTLFHVVLLVFAAMATWSASPRSPARSVGLLLVGMTAYVVFAVISYASFWENYGFFSNISSLPSFFFPLVPVVFALSAGSLLVVVRAVSRGARKMRRGAV